MCGLYFSQSSFKIKDKNIDKIISSANISIKKKKISKYFKSFKKIKMQ